jgi:hypothetical protein
MAAAGVRRVRRLLRSSVGVPDAGDAAVAGGIFAAYLLVALLVLIAQPFKPKNAICSAAKLVVKTLLRGVFLLSIDDAILKDAY